LKAFQIKGTESFHSLTLLFDKLQNNRRKTSVNEIRSVMRQNEETNSISDGSVGYSVKSVMLEGKV